MVFSSKLCQKLCKAFQKSVFEIDLETLTSLATDYFKPYDYILGDYSYGKLRLKGFYRDNNKKATKINKFSYLDEYIKNYCSYGCSYFILEKAKK